MLVIPSVRILYKKSEPFFNYPCEKCGLGLYDMSGNLWEWCWNWYVAYTGGTVTDYTGAVRGSYRFQRGGSLNSIAPFTTVAYRIITPPVSGNYYDGFRVVRL